LLISFDQSRAGGSNLPRAEGVCEVGTLMTRCMGDAALAANLLRRFDGRLVQVVSEIEMAVAESNWTDASRRAHSLKGEAGSLAATRVQHAAGALEHSLRGGRTSEVTELVERLKTSCEQLRHELPALARSLATPVKDEA
jgi:two-component system, sensor histidine kinase and response regulator